MEETPMSTSDDLVRRLRGWAVGGPIDNGPTPSVFTEAANLITKLEAEKTHLIPVIYATPDGTSDPILYEGKGLSTIATKPSWAPMQRQLWAHRLDADPINIGYHPSPSPRQSQHSNQQQQEEETNEL